MNYWIGVASLDHLERGIQRGMFGIGHGKKAPLDLMKPGDKIVFYLPKKVYAATGPENIYQKFCGFATIDEGDVFSEQIGERCMFRKRLTFTDTTREVPIREVLDQLSFIKDKTHWGFPFMRGYVQITQKDWEILEGYGK